jgi:hypothetical protein
VRHPWPVRTRRCCRSALRSWRLSVPRDGVSDQHGRCHHRGPGRLGHLSEYLAGPAAGAVRGEQGAQAEPRRRPDIADAPYRSGNVLIHHTSPVIPGRDHGRARAATADAGPYEGAGNPVKPPEPSAAPATDAQAVPDAQGAAARRGRASPAAMTGRFLASSIGTPIEPRNVNRRWDDLRVKAGLDWLRLHACGTDVRRSCWLRAYQRGRSGRYLTTARLRSR